MSVDRRVRDDPTAEEADDDDDGNRPVVAIIIIIMLQEIRQGSPYYYPLQEINLATRSPRGSGF